MKFNKMKMLPLVAKLGEYLKIGFEYYPLLESADLEQKTELLNFYLSEKMADWNPQINGKVLLDDETRAAASRFVAGVAVNLAK
jgi:hypothetical protein